LAETLQKVHKIMENQHDVRI